ncbi:MAG: universal stress protein [Euzebyales bacterium]|nr:universal stress protein [Euzebyales bacterium]
MTRIIVGYISSDEGRAALDRAIEETKLRGGQLVVVHSMRGGERDEAAKATSYRRELRAVEERLDAEGVAYEVRELVRGKPAGDDLAAFANEERADLIVIGLRRRSPVGKLVLGSNAQDVLLQADCPVLAVKAG